MTAKTVGPDLAKGVFQVHCIPATRRRIIKKAQTGEADRLL